MEVVPANAAPIEGIFGITEVMCACEKKPLQKRTVAKCTASVQYALPSAKDYFTANNKPTTKKKSNSRKNTNVNKHLANIFNV